MILVVINYAVVAVIILTNGVFVPMQLAYSYTNALDWYGSQYRQPENFVPNTKKGAKVKRLKNTGRFGLAESALVHSRQN